MTISTITCYTADIVQLHKPFVFKVCHYKPLFENSVEIFIGGDLTDLLNLGYIWIQYTYAFNVGICICSTG